MAQTFTIDQSAPVLDTVGGAPQLLGNVSTAGPVSANAPVADPGMNSATTDALFKLGSDILRPRVKAAAQEQFMEGVRVAATGQALTDIIAERPWYTEVFGPSSAVQGAQTYTVATRIAKFGADMESKMPSLAQQGPEAITAEMQSQMEALQTGDPVADAAITSQFVDQMAPLYKRHAKEHYAFQQKQASTAQVAAWSALGSGFQQRAAAAAKGDSMVNPADVAADADRLIGSMSPFADQGDDSYNKNVTDFLAASATAGNFQVVKLFKDRGLYQQLPAANRDGLDRVFRAAGAQTLANAMPQFGLDVAMLVNDTAQDPRLIASRVEALNKRAAAATGVDVETAQLIPRSGLDNVIGGVLRAQASGNAKALEAQQTLAIAQSQINAPGGAGPCKEVGLCKETAIEQAALSQFNAAQTPQAKAALLNNNGTLMFGAIKSNLVMQMNTKEDTPGMQATAQVYSQMNEETRGRYFSADEQKFLDRYTASVQAGQAPAAAFQLAKVVQPIAKYYLDPKEKSEVAGSIRTWVEKTAERVNGVPGWFGVNGIDDAGLRTMEMVVGSQVAKNRGGQSVDITVARQLAAARQTGQIQIVGTKAILGDYSTQRPLTDILSKGENNMGEQETAKQFEAVFEEKAKAVGLGTSDEYTIIRLPDTAGKARFSVEMVDKEGKVVSFSLNSDELRARNKPKPSKAAASAGAATMVDPTAVAF